ncbi:hypothetical protein [Coleofasciculus sp. F4-SAH-05]|uniref:hypothetical protein n=2 Tax=Coleofasciculus TaxID=669368 RepID=UPI003304F501
MTVEIGELLTGNRKDLTIKILSKADRIDVQVLNYSKSPEKLPCSTYSRRAMARLYGGLSDRETALIREKSAHLARFDNLPYHDVSWFVTNGQPLLESESRLLTIPTTDGLTCR